jgi:hypothetical protein
MSIKSLYVSDISVNSSLRGVSNDSIIQTLSCIISVGQNTPFFFVSPSGKNIVLNVSDLQQLDERRMLEVQHSSKTRYTYEYQIKKFLTYCGENEIPVLKVIPQDVDSYMNYLNNGLSPRSVRNNIMGVNSFFKFMIYRYPDCFKLNPFRDKKLPKIVDTRKKDFCTIDDG